MQYSPIKKDASPEAMAALQSALGGMSEAEQLETELQAHAFSQRCMREIEEKERQDKTELITTEILQVAATPAVGALATWKTTNGIPVGGFINGIIGAAGKVVSFRNPKNRTLRVAGRVGKVALHSQLSILTKTLLEELP